MKNLKGLGVALVTPFKANKEVDYEAIEKLVKHQIDGGTDYLVVQGTTGESATLNKEEKQQILDFVLKVNAGVLPIVLGIGGNDTKAMVEAYNQFNLTGVTAILSASPYYNKPSQEGIYQHYKYLTAYFKLPIVLYNVPGRTASNMSSETTLRLANDFPDKIIGIKEASGDLGQVMNIIKDKPEEFLMISGDDRLTLPLIAAGAEGLISVVANAYPKETSKLMSLSLQGNFKEARKYHYKLLELIHYLFADGNPGGVKEVLKGINICTNDVRLPLVPVNKEVKNKLIQLMSNI
jgi:4-hydroxy-tetrahydrodipicolinate synthase